mgnify:CR=1 FL=1
MMHISKEYKQRVRFFGCNLNNIFQQLEIEIVDWLLYNAMILCLEVLAAAVIVYIRKLGHMVRDVAKMVCTLLQLERDKRID